MWTKNAFTLHPDCGFSPSVQNPMDLMDLDEAYPKLKQCVRQQRCSVNDTPD